MLRLFYACYFTGVAVTMPFFPPYLRGLGLSGRQISLMLATAPVLYMFTPLAWGWLADRTRRPDVVLRIVLFGAFLGVLPLIFVRTMPEMLGVYALHQLFSVAIIGLVDSLALERVRQGDDYGRIRVWGSVSFALTCAVVGSVLAARGAVPADRLVPMLMAGTLAGSFLASLGLAGRRAEPERPHASEVWLLLRDRRFLLLLAVAPLHWAACAPYNGFFAILVQDRGLSPAVAAQGFTISVVGEIAVLYFFRRLRARFRLVPLLALAFAATVARWWAIAAIGPSAIGLVALQTIHALTFGVFWAAAVAWLGECVSPRLRATGQTLFTAMTFGVGNIVGVLGTGWLYDAFGGAGPAFVIAGVVELLPLALIVLHGRRLEPAAAVVRPVPSPAPGTQEGAPQAPPSAGRLPSPPPES